MATQWIIEYVGVGRLATWRVVAEETGVGRVATSWVGVVAGLRSVACTAVTWLEHFGGLMR
jgi:hypothetical protein